MSSNKPSQYEDVRDGGSIAFVRGIVTLPESLATLAETSLSPEMRLVVDTAREIYSEYLLSSTIVDDEQPRLLLVFKANIPEAAVSLRVNLRKLATEIANGLHPNVLKQALNVLT